MSDDVFNKLLPILPTIGWVCEDCVGLLTVKRNTLKKEIASLQTTVSRMETEFLVLVNRVNELSTKVEIPEKPLSQLVINTTPARQTYDDKCRFKVMVSGLVESTDKQDDKQTIKELLHTTLELQPTIVSCRRVGKTMPDSPRKLLVSFAHASARDDVLALAKEKKLSLLPASKGIFINPDLSPAEAKAAYEARQARRMGAPANPTSEVVSPLPVKPIDGTVSIIHLTVKASAINSFLYTIFYVVQFTGTLTLEFSQVSVMQMHYGNLAKLFVSRQSPR
jgi:hypothetical protein